MPTIYYLELLAKVHLQSVGPAHNLVLVAVPESEVHLVKQLVNVGQFQDVLVDHLVQ